MEKYTCITSALNNISQSVRDHYDQGMLTQFLYDGYQRNVRIKTIKYEYKIAIVKLVNHQARLPKDILKLGYALYSTVKPENNLTQFKTYYIRDLTQKVIGTDNITDLSSKNENQRAMIAQVHFYNELKGTHNYRPMKFRGQNNNLIANSCIKVYPDCCNINFSFDKEMTVIRTSEKEGYVALVYLSHPLSENGEILIPDDPVLLAALGKFAEQQYANEKRFSAPSRFFNLYISLQREASQLFREFIANWKLENLDVDAMSSIDDNPFLHIKYTNYRN